MDSEKDATENLGSSLGYVAIDRGDGVVRYRMNGIDIIVPDCFVLSKRKRARQRRDSSDSSDVQIGPLVFEVPASYWCHKCDGSGCDKCGGSGIEVKVNRRAERRIGLGCVAFFDRGCDCKYCQGR
jgi:hypothetical protein